MYKLITLVSVIMLTGCAASTAAEEQATTPQPTKIVEGTPVNLNSKLSNHQVRPNSNNAQSQAAKVISPALH
jgi:uncharacterized lipoprotein YajG